MDELEWLRDCALRKHNELKKIPLWRRFGGEAMQIRRDIFHLNARRQMIEAITRMVGTQDHLPRR